MRNRYSTNTVARIVLEELRRIDATYVKEIDKILGALRARDYRTIALVVDNPPAQCTVEQSHMWAQIVAAVSKLDGQYRGMDPEGKAKTRYNTSEWACKWVNRRILAWSRRTGRGKPFVDLVTRMQLFIESVLGREPQIETILGMARFGPGTSVGVTGDSTHYLAKMAGVWSVTKAAYPYALAAMRQIPAAWETLGLLSPDGRFLDLDPSKFEVAFLNRVQFVEAEEALMVNKNAKTKRFISKQPTLNGFVQNGVGDLMTMLLKPHGFEAENQTRNARLACEGSLGGPNSLVTMDLSMASDTLAKEVVRLLLPPAWWQLLNRLRAPEVVMTFDSSDNRQLEKFSAMGNGFTFPLETLIFMAACHAVSNAPHQWPVPQGVRPTVSSSLVNWSVYGDDIICRQADALLLVELLRFIGFRTNVDKTFLFGPFRESCGSDYYEGVDIRPVFIEGEFLGDLELIGLHNSFMRSCFFIPLSLCARLRSLAKRPLTKPVWNVNGDGAFMVPIPEFLVTGCLGYNKPMQSYVWREYLVSPVVDQEYGTREGPITLLAAAILGASPRFLKRKRKRMDDTTTREGLSESIESREGYGVGMYLRRAYALRSTVINDDSEDSNIQWLENRGAAPRSGSHHQHRRKAHKAKPLFH